MTEYELFAIDLAREAARVSLPYFRGAYEETDKGSPGAFDPVTQADREAEAALRALIATRYPDHGVIGEEYGEDRAEADHVWILDPIDGTRAFIAGLPVWTTLISLRWRGEPVLSSIGQPYLGEVFIGSPEGSRLVRGGESRPLRVRPCFGLSEATIASTDPIGYFGADEKAAWDRVRAAARLARLGCDAYAYAMVAAGSMDLVLESRACKSWDIEAAVPLLAGAGGVATDWNGMPIGRNGGQLVVVGDRACLEEALPLLKSAAD